MIEVRPFSSLGHADHGWLDASHHFSFAGYHDPNRVHWGALRVWKDDTIAPHTGFAPHPHNDMEIITYVRSGAISHKDSLGNAGRTEAGDVQVMSAGTGIVHSEKNEEDVPTTLFQIWIIPDAQGDKPGWGTRPFPKGDRSGRFVTLASGIAGEEDALPIRANARVLGATIRAGESATHRIGRDRKAYLVATEGRIEVNGVAAQPRDGVAIADLDEVTITAIDDAEIVLVDIA